MSQRPVPYLLTHGYSHLCSAMSKSHASCRSVSDWVLWAQTEGFTDIVEKAPHGEPIPGKCVPLFWCVICFWLLGKVYCAICGFSLTPKTSHLRDHCLGKFGPGGTRITSQHAKKVEARKNMQEAQPPPPALPQNIVINVCRFPVGFFTFKLLFFSTAGSQI